ATMGGGLGRLEHNVFKFITAKDGLIDDVIYDVIEDDRNNIWMSSRKGLFRCSRKDLNDLAGGRKQKISGLALGVSDGLASAQCWGANSPSSWKDRDGVMWFPLK